MERVEEQARRFGVSRGAELARLVIHGALHLAGLDHQRPAARRHMRAREDAAMAAGRAHAARLEGALGGPAARRTRRGRTAARAARRPA
jgi:ssRNA-specific RNase YbeY (16S rRNA maturation enzyme)